MAAVATLRSVGAVHSISIDIIINDNDNNFNKQTSIAISTVHAHNLSSFLYNRFAPSQSFSPIDARFSLSFRSVWILASARTPVYAISFIIALAARCSCRRPCIASILVLALPPAHRTGTCPRTYASTCTLHRHYSNCQ
jgi:hypothetical protein